MVSIVSSAVEARSKASAQQSGLVLTRALKTSVSFRVEVERTLKLARVLIATPSGFDVNDADVKVTVSLLNVVVLH